MKILQIIPATGWFACYEEKSSLQDKPLTFSNPLVCWALVKCDDGIVIVTGMEAEPKNGTILFTPSRKKFIAYSNYEENLS